MTFRKILFWFHLTCGCTAGAIVLLMSVTGVLLTYERQMLAWAERGSFRQAPAAGEAGRLPVEQLMTGAAAMGKSSPASITLRSDPAEPLEINYGPQGVLYLNPYTGQVLGTGGSSAQAVFRTLREWHRWLGNPGAGRDTAKAITGACNLAFLGLVVTGAYLWLPRRLNWRSLRPVVWFRRGLRGKARDFNWHNTIGLWCVVPLLFVVIGAVPISYQWGTALVYRIAGSEPPTPPPAKTPPANPPAQPDTVPPEVLLAGGEPLWTRAMNQAPGWRAITLKVPVSLSAPFEFTIDEGTGGQPQKRSDLKLERASGAILAWQPFDSLDAGRRLRSWLRFTHTGEAFGLVGQTIAGLASLGGAFLAFTGISLSLRRFAAWRQRRPVRTEELVGKA